MYLCCFSSHDQYISTRNVLKKVSDMCKRRGKVYVLMFYFAFCGLFSSVLRSAYGVNV